MPLGPTQQGFVEEVRGFVIENRKQVGKVWGTEEKNRRKEMEGKKGSKGTNESFREV